MQVKLANGSMGEITLEEGKRIHGEVAKMMPAGTAMHHMHETPEEYKKRALECIRKTGGEIGIRKIEDSEEEMKEVLAVALGIDDKTADLLGEIIEWFIAEHDQKVK
jgi:hypothetical protein